VLMLGRFTQAEVFCTSYYTYIPSSCFKLQVGILTLIIMMMHGSTVTAAFAPAAGFYSGLRVLVGGGVPFTSLVISSLIVVGRGGVHMLLANIRSKLAGGGAELRSVLL
jgi:hypothetical protein